MLYYNRIDISEGIDLTKIITTVKNVRFVIIGFLIMDLNVKILYAMVVLIWHC